MTGKRAIFVDLDGTLLQGNSLLLFMKYLPKYLAKRGCVGALAKFFCFAGLRLMRLISHKDMKWYLTRLSKRHLRQDDWNDLASLMASNINPDVKSFLNSPQYSDCAKFIASAAIEEYVLPLARMSGFDGAIATHFTPDKEQYEEARGESKLRAIEALLSSKGYRMECFLTDHRDDLPAAKVYPANTILVNPDSRSLVEFNKIGVSRLLGVPVLQHDLCQSGQDGDSRNLR